MGATLLPVIYAINNAAPSTDSFFAAIAAAKMVDGIVYEVRENGDRLQRWAPAPKKTTRRVRHVLVNKDGTETEFGSVKSHG